MRIDIKGKTEELLLEAADKAGVKPTQYIIDLIHKSQTAYCKGCYRKKLDEIVQNAIEINIWIRNNNVDRPEVSVEYCMNIENQCTGSNLKIEDVINDPEFRQRLKVGKTVAKQEDLCQNTVNLDPTKT